MHSMKYVQSKLFLSDCTKGATSSCFSFYTLVANKGIPANSHVLFVSLMHQGQFLLPNSQIWTNCFLTHDKGPFIIYRLGGLWGFFPAPSPHESLQTKVKYHDPPLPLSLTHQVLNLTQNLMTVGTIGRSIQQN